MVCGIPPSSKTRKGRSPRLDVTHDMSLRNLPKLSCRGKCFLLGVDIKSECVVRSRHFWEISNLHLTQINQGVTLAACVGVDLLGVISNF